METCGTAFHARYLDLIKIIGIKVNTFPISMISMKTLRKTSLYAGSVSTPGSCYQTLCDHRLCASGFLFWIVDLSGTNSFGRPENVAAVFVLNTFFSNTSAVSFQLNSFKETLKKILEHHKQKATQTNKL